MATVVQSKSDSTNTAAPALVLDTAATTGNDIIYLGFADTQFHSAACTFNGSNMTTVLDTEFGLWRIARFRVTAGGTTFGGTFGSATNWRGIILEVSGLDSAGAEETVVKTVTGEGSSTSHSCEYSSGTAGRWGIAGWPGGDPVTFTGANGATAINVSTTTGVAYKDALGSSAGSIDFTVSSAKTYDYMLATFLTTGGGGGPVVPVVAAGLLRMINN